MFGGERADVPEFAIANLQDAEDRAAVSSHASVDGPSPISVILYLVYI